MYPSCSRRATLTPIRRVVLVATLALVAAATMVAGQPAGPLPSSAANSGIPATAIAIQAT